MMPPMMKSPQGSPVLRNNRDQHNNKGGLWGLSPHMTNIFAIIGIGASLLFVSRTLVFSIQWISSPSLVQEGNSLLLDHQHEQQHQHRPAPAQSRRDEQQQQQQQQQQQRLQDENPPPGIRTKTDGGVDVDMATNPALWEGFDLTGDPSSSTATVMGMASGYGLDVYQRFVGSLRKTGYKGHIILGVAPDVSQEILDYFAWRNVIPKIQQWVPCTYSVESAIFNKTKCAHPYPDIKIRWSRFPLARDWLADCQTCTGPVLIMDVRDSYFQLNPFGPGSQSTILRGLQVYEEHKSQRTLHWLTDHPFKQCKGTTMNETMLCSGTTTGTRAAMLTYLDAMYAEMKTWITIPKCRFDFNGDDQTIHNWLYYTGQLPFARAYANRAGGIVNTVGVEGSIIAKQHAQNMMKQYNIEQGEAMWKPFPGAADNNGDSAGQRWIGKEYNMANDEGLFTEADGSISRVIHQWDRFGRPFVDLWLPKQDFVKDPMPPKQQ